MRNTLLYHQTLAFTINGKNRIYYSWKNIKKSCKSNTFKISAPTWNEEFELTDLAYSVSDIQDYFENNMEKIPIILQQECVCVKKKKKKKNRITYRTKTGYFYF